MPKATLIPLIKPIEAIRIHARTGNSLGLPEVTVPYGALIEHNGTDGEREKFTYLGELYACRRDVFQTATGGGKKSPPNEESAPADSSTATENAPTKAHTQPAEINLEWESVKSSEGAVSRAKVPGGWLMALNGQSITFVPDPNHSWTSR